jgi:uncharacterized protein (DUF1684 family)
MSDISYVDSIQKLRNDRDQRVKANPLNWLSLAGLFPLEEGDNSFGGDEKAGIFFPTLSREQYGSFHLEGERVTIFAETESGVTIHGSASTNQLIQTDTDRLPDLIEVGTLAMKIIHRGSQYYLRVWDRESPAWKNFAGYHYYPVRSEYSITADFLLYDSPRIIKVQDVIGNISDSRFPGEAHFKVNGIACTLIAEDSEDELLFSFNDKTREDDTYPGGRFITTTKPENGRVTLDFNLAVNWPCAYTSYATCPLPPFENRLSVRIEAGELKYHD